MEVLLLPKVKMLTSMAGLTFSYVPGDVVEVEDYIAEAWKEANIAEIVEEKKATIKKGDK
jgi:hypothetical protein